MHVLFVHQNFPAQFRCVAPRLAADYGWTCTFATHNAAIPAPSGIDKVLYRVRSGPHPLSHPCTRGFESGTGHALGVYEALKARPDVKPDLVVAHSGFGSSLFLPHLYDCPVVNFFEYFFRPAGQQLGYRPELPVTESALLRWRMNNAMILHDLEACDAGWSPSESQRETFPAEYRGKIEVIPEGIDTDLYRPKPQIPSSKLQTGSKAESGTGSNGERVLPDGTVVPADTRVVTYVSRGFEMMRGFDLFMKAAKRIYRQFSDVLFVVVGSDRVAYGTGEERGTYRSFRERVLAEGDYDLSKFRFTGRLPEPALAELLSISDLHIYLTVPFVTSWSMLDAMASGCVVLASDQACTREYITHGRNGLLCDLFDVEGIAWQALEVLKDPAAYRVLGTAARLTIEEEYSVNACLPRLKAFFEAVAAKGPRTPSLRAQGLVRSACGAGVSPAVGERQGGRLHHKHQVQDLPPFDGAIPFHVGGIRGPSPKPSPLSTGERGQEGKTVLFCWELGAGLGHLMQMLPLAVELSRAGHRVFVALRHLEQAAALYGSAGVTFLQAPGRFAPARAKFPRPASFAQLLANFGFDEPLDLFAVACAWRNLYRMVGPDLIVFDHAPTALLAARGLDVRRAIIGSGFCCPPDEFPLPVFRPEARGTADPARLGAFEAQVLGAVNGQLTRWGEAPLERLGQLYGDVDENFLTTFPELDHYPQRAQTDVAYWGPVVSANGCGDEPRWPDSTASGRRVFAYLKPFHHLPNVLHALADAGHSTLVYVEGAGAGLRKRFESQSLRFADGPVDLASVGRECDAAVLNGGHGVTAEMLLAGRPVVQVPLALEQRLTAEAVMRLGAGESAGAGSIDAVRAAVDRVVSDPSYAQAARRFAERYAAFDPATQRRAMLARAEELLAGAEATAPTERVGA